MNKETIEAHEFESFLERVKKAPKIGPEEVSEMDSRQFGNNFYLLFIARKRLLENPEKNLNDTLVKIYLRRAEQYGDAWQKFTNNNLDLLKRIDQLLDGEHKEYTEISGFALKLLNNRFYDMYEQLDTAVDHPLGLDAIGIRVWRKFNPLLKDAASKMQDCGIPPEKFFG